MSKIVNKKVAGPDARKPLSKVRLANVREHRAPLARRSAKATHLLLLLPADKAWHGVDEALPAEHADLLAVLKRQDKKPDALVKGPLRVELPGGCLSVWMRLDAGKSAFEQQTQLRKAVQVLLDEHPAEIEIAVYGSEDFRNRVAQEVVQVAWLNSVPLPNWKSEESPRELQRIELHGAASADGLARSRALVEGNALARGLTLQPPNFLTPGRYREHIKALAKTEGWALQEYDIKRLKQLKAGTFLAVARGSGHNDAAIVRLTYTGKAKKGNAIALVGKGICFDTGGHNLKPARYMHNMHDDMAGSAVVLGILLAASRLKLPVNLDCWLAIAENHLSPEAYTQNEVVTALNGTSIEVIHTDAEGRMVLADTLALAAREKPEMIVDFATLTGSMVVAVGERMSGVIGNRDGLLEQAVLAGKLSGERVVAFPLPEDYDEALESQVADIKQCTLDGEADHILAARFLKRFVDDQPWLHVDLSACRCKGGLGAVASDVTGFGVGLGLALVEGR